MGRAAGRCERRGGAPSERSRVRARSLRKRSRVAGASSRSPRPARCSRRSLGSRCSAPISAGPAGWTSCSRVSVLTPTTQWRQSDRGSLLRDMKIAIICNHLLKFRRIDCVYLPVKEVTSLPGACRWGELVTISLAFCDSVQIPDPGRHELLLPQKAIGHKP